MLDLLLLPLIHEVLPRARVLADGDARLARGLLDLLKEQCHVGGVKIEQACGLVGVPPLTLAIVLLAVVSPAVHSAAPVRATRRREPLPGAIAGSRDVP